MSCSPDSLFTCKCECTELPNESHIELSFSYLLALIPEIQIMNKPLHGLPLCSVHPHPQPLDKMLCTHCVSSASIHSGSGDKRFVYDVLTISGWDVSAQRILNVIFLVLNVDVLTKFFFMKTSVRRGNTY